jgi:ABC-type bacteriocin/lantibiotic exporter with double-glycine peptidase domain
MSLGTGFFINNKSSILRSRLESIPRDAVYFVELTQSTIQGLMEVMVVSVILLNINPRFALISFGFFIVSAGIFQYLKSFINRTTVNRAVANIQFNSVLQDILMRSSLITATSNQEKESQYFMDEYAKMTKKRFYFEQIQNLIYPFSILFQIVAVLAMVLLLGNTVLFNPVNSASAALVFIVLFHRGIIKTQNLVISYLQRIGTKNALLATMQNISDLKPATVSGTTHFDTIQI